jgi:uncharacterized protein YkwD
MADIFTDTTIIFAVVSGIGIAPNCSKIVGDTCMKFSRSIVTMAILSVASLSTTAATFVPQLIQPAPAVAQAATDTATLERNAHNQINAYRQSKGLTAFTWNETIAAQARKHSQDMASGRVPFSHQGFSTRVVATRIAYSSAAENVAYNRGFSDPATQAVQGWLKSAGHKRNIEGNYNLAGLGVARNAKGEVYFTQVFIRSR